MALGQATVRFMALSGLLVLAINGVAQIDPYHRNLVQLGYDQPLSGSGPQGIYAFYYYSNPELVGTNTALRLAIAPVYLDGEIGFRQLISRTTDLGVGFYGGAFGDNYYEVRQGHYYKGESFYGHGGGAALSLYQLLNPNMQIPLNLIARGGLRYALYDETSDTDKEFVLPDNRFIGFVRGGLRLAGKEPLLYADLGMEVSIWYERQWRSPSGEYGFNDDRRTEHISDLFWLYAGLDYAWTNVGHRISFAVTSGASENADRFSAWRLGGVLPLISELPLILPGYYYEELTAKRFVHLYASYLFPLDPGHRFQFRIEAATACAEYLEGFEQPDRWQTGVGAGLIFTPKSKRYRIVARYGYGFNALREGDRGAQSVGLLFQYDFEQGRNRR